MNQYLTYVTLATSRAVFQLDWQVTGVKCRLYTLQQGGNHRGCWLVWRQKRAAAPLQLCICWGHWQQEEVTEPPQLSAVLQLLHTTYQKDLGKELPNKLTYSSTHLPLNK